MKRFLCLLFIFKSNAVLCDYRQSGLIIANQGKIIDKNLGIIDNLKQIIDNGKSGGLIIANQGKIIDKN
ncbi:hypothetical protein MTP04_11330 [Lysinibacillus sp. PLM2]|nr:hypothetical protein MTP04_11330 [Lysinibacillus sp. PLM2]